MKRKSRKSELLAYSHRTPAALFSVSVSLDPLRRVSDPAVQCADT
jgi:hypothetical protein